MIRLTVDKPTAEMNMTELAHNGCYAEKRLARYRDFDRDIDARDFARELMDVFNHGEDEELLADDDTFDEIMFENLQYESTTIRGLIALFYRNLWAMADLHSKLKHYEDLEEQGRLIELPCKVGDEFWELNDVHDIPAIYPRYAHTLFHCIYVLEGLGRRAFLTKEEAEARLKELEEGAKE
jgi:hypothetical protein